METFPPDSCLVLPKDLPHTLYRRLVMVLSENNSWCKIAERFLEADIFSEEDLLTLKQCQQPAERLLNELGFRLCDVGSLCTLLEECGLYNALMLFRCHEPTVITQQPFGNGDDNSTMITRGYTLRLSCKAHGLPPPSYQWCLESEIQPGIWNNERLDGQTNPELVLFNFDAEHEGEYFCELTQHGYETEVSDSVTVLLAPEHPVIVTEPKDQLVCRSGASLLITVTAQGHPRLCYQWFKGSRQLDGFNSPDFQLEVVNVNDEGDYRCYICNSAGEVWSNPCRVAIYASPEDLNDQMPRPVASAKVALLIANQEYENMNKLNTPVEDVRTLAEILIQHNFHVIALQNLNLVEMKNAIKELCKLLPENAYVVFYYAGHGFKMRDKHMLPVNAPGPESYLKKDSVSEGELLRDVLNKHPQVFLELLDMCLKSPEQDKNKAIFEEVTDFTPYSANSNLIQGYSTTSYLSAYERKNEKNGLFVKYLKQYLLMDASMVSILENVAKDMEKELAKECVRQKPYRGTNVTKEYRLTDPCEVAEEVKQKFEMLTRLPDIQVVRLKNCGLECMVTFAPYLDVYCNAVQVIFSNLQGYHVTCDTRVEELRLLMERRGEELVITIMNLQKVQTEEELSLELKSRQDGAIDYAKWFLGKPMIAIAELWLEDTETQNRPENGSFIYEEEI